ncbi:hypothetical protein BLA29_000664, partial [Euroglyphus maynei]
QKIESDSGFFQKPDSSSSTSDIFINQTEDKFEKNFIEMKRPIMPIMTSKQQSVDENVKENNQLDPMNDQNDDDDINEEQIYDKQSQESKHLNSKLNNPMTIEDSLTQYDNDNNEKNLNVDVNDYEKDFHDDEKEIKDRPTMAHVYQLINYARPSWPTRNDIIEEIKQRSLKLKDSK